MENKTYLIVGVANKKSVAYNVARIIETEGGKLVFSVQDEEKKEFVKKNFSNSSAVVCDVTDRESIEALVKFAEDKCDRFAGLFHSVAYAPYSGGPVPFHEIDKSDFMKALDASFFSLIALCNALKQKIDKEKGSVVTVSISTTTMASENYGYMAPIKAALDSSLAFLCKSFSQFSNIRFNAVAPSLLKTSASAGIPNYVDSYLFAEKVIPRKKAITTVEAANSAVFLLSEASSGINAGKIIVDAGMGTNYFDREIVSKSIK